MFTDPFFFYTYLSQVIIISSRESYFFFFFLLSFLLVAIETKTNVSKSIGWAIISFASYPRTRVIITSSKQFQIL